MKSNGQDALELAEIGLMVFPLHTWVVDHCSCPDPLCGTLDEQGQTIGSPAKHPRTMHGLADATTAIEQIVKWWGAWPSANVGVRTGPESRIVVLDIDPRSGGMEAWEDLREQHTYEHIGPACITGGGGMHLWFKHPGTKVKSVSGSLGNGLDVKGDGGYVVVPPSVHRTGASYYWIEGYAPWERELTEIPGWLLALMQAPVSQDKHEGVPGGERLTKGKRNGGLLSLAGVMRQRNFGEAAIYNALLAENEERCEPPLSIQEVAQIAKSIMRYPLGSATILPSTSPGKKGSERREEAYVPVPRTLEELQGLELPPINWAVGGLLPQGLAMMAGAAKLGKSFMVLGLVVAIGRGEDAFEYLPTQVGDCLYLALEDGENRLQTRMMGILDDERWPARVWYETKWPRFDNGGKESLEAWLGLHPEARLIVVDTFALFKPLDAGKSSKDVYAADYASIRQVKAIADEYGVCILLVTHLNKGEHQDWVNGMTGSTGLSGSADTLLNLARPDGTGRDVAVKNEATLRLTGRDVEEQAWACERDKRGRWSIVGDAVEQGEKRSSNQTVNYMQMLWQDGYQEVDATLLRTLSGATKATANKGLANTAGAGLIMRVRQGVYVLMDKDKPR